MNSSHRRVSPLGRRHRRGTTIIEYALIGAIIAIAAIVGIEQLSDELVLSFHLVDRSFAGESATPRARNEHSNTAAAQAIAEPRRQSWSATVILVVAVVGWLVERRTRKTRGAESILAAQPNPTAAEFANTDVLRLRYAQKRLRILHDLIQDNHKLLPTDLRVSDLMTEEVKKSSPSATVAELRRLTTAHGFRHILVCNEQGTLVGVVGT